MFLLGPLTHLEQQRNTKFPNKVHINTGDIEQHLYTLRGIGSPGSKLANEGYVIFHKRFQYG